MEVIAKGKYIKVSPKKAREIAPLIRGKGAKEAKEVLRFLPHAAAKEIYKVVSSAVSNAHHNFSLEPDALKISSITVDGGPALKRYRPAARGRAAHIKRKTSHITVVVSGDVKTKKVAAPKQKAAIKEEAVPESVEKEAEEHKIEVEKPEFIKEQAQAPKIDIKGKFFRRKTG